MKNNFTKVNLEYKEIKSPLCVISLTFAFSNILQMNYSISLTILVVL